MKCLLAHKVVSATCSYHHSILLCADGSLFSCGRNDFGQLGHGDVTDRRTPQLVEPPILDIQQISCGQFHSTILTKQNVVYICGKNDYGQLGFEGTDSVRVFTKLSLPSSDTITQVCCGYYHTLLLSSNGSVFGFGRNDFGQLGLGHVQQRVNKCTMITSLRDKNVTSVAAGCYHSIAITSNGMLYVFGRNNHGQLGTGDSEERHSPHPVDEFLGKHIVSIAAGFYHTVVLVTQETNNKSTGFNDVTPEFVISPPTSPTSKKFKSISSKRVDQSAGSQEELPPLPNMDHHDTQAAVLDNPNPITQYFNELDLASSMTVDIKIYRQLFSPMSPFSINDLLGYLSDNLYVFISNCSTIIPPIESSITTSEKGSESNSEGKDANSVENRHLLKTIRLFTLIMELCRNVIYDVLDTDVSLTSREASVLLRNSIIAARIFLSQNGNKLKDLESKKYSDSKSPHPDDNMENINANTLYISELLSRPQVHASSSMDMLSVILDEDPNKMNTEPSSQSDSTDIISEISITMNRFRQELFTIYFYLPTNDLLVNNSHMNGHFGDHIIPSGNISSPQLSTINVAGSIDIQSNYSSFVVQSADVSNILTSTVELSGSIISKYIDILFPTMTEYSQLLKHLASQIMNITTANKVNDDMFHDSINSFELEYDSAMDYLRCLRLFSSICFKYRSIQDVMALISSSQPHGFFIFHQVITVYNSLSLTFLETKTWPFLNISENEFHRILGALDHCNANFTKVIAPIIFHLSCMEPHENLSSESTDHRQSYCYVLGYQIFKEILTASEAISKHLLAMQIFDDHSFVLRNTTVLPTILPTFVLYGIAQCISIIDKDCMNTPFIFYLQEGLIKDIQSLVRVLICLSKSIPENSLDLSSSMPNTQKSMKSSQESSQSMANTSQGSSSLSQQNGANKKDTGNHSKDGYTINSSAWWAKLLKLCNIWMTKIAMVSFNRMNHISKNLNDTNPSDSPILWSSIVCHNVWLYQYAPTVPYHSAINANTLARSSQIISNNINSSQSFAGYKLKSKLSTILSPSLRAQEMMNDGTYKILVSSSRNMNATMIIEKIELNLFDAAICNLFGTTERFYPMDNPLLSHYKLFQQLWHQIAIFIKSLHSKRSFILSSDSSMSWIGILQSILMIIERLGHSMVYEGKSRIGFENSASWLSKTHPRISRKAVTLWRKALLQVIGVIRWRNSCKRRVKRYGLIMIEFMTLFLEQTTKSFMKCDEGSNNKVWEQYQEIMKKETCQAVRYCNAIKLFDSSCRMTNFLSIKIDSLVTLLQAWNLRHENQSNDALRQRYQSTFTCCVSMELFHDQQTCLKKLKGLVVRYLEEFIENHSNSLSASTQDLTYLTILVTFLHQIFQQSYEDVLFGDHSPLNMISLLQLSFLLDEKFHTGIQTNAMNASNHLTVSSSQENPIQSTNDSEASISPYIAHGFPNNSMFATINELMRYSSHAKSLLSQSLSTSATTTGDHDDSIATAPNKTTSPSNVSKKTNTRDRTRALKRASAVVIGFLQDMLISSNPSIQPSKSCDRRYALSLSHHLNDQHLDMQYWLCTMMQSGRLLGSRQDFNESESNSLSATSSLTSISNSSSTTGNMGSNTMNSDSFNDTGSSFIASAINMNATKTRDQTNAAKRRFQDLITKPMEFHPIFRRSIVVQGDRLINSTKGIDFTLATWIYLHRVSNEPGFIAGKLSHNDAWPVLLVRSDKKLEVVYGHGNDLEKLVSALSIPAMTWTHVAIVVEQKKIRLYINGALDCHATASKANARAILYPVIIGNCRTLNGNNRIKTDYFREGFQGCLANFKYYTRGLSPIHVKIVYDQGPPESIDTRERWMYRLLASIKLATNPQSKPVINQSIKLTQQSSISRLIGKKQETNAFMDSNRRAIDTLLMIIITETVSSRLRCASLSILEKILSSGIELQDVTLPNNSGFSSARYTATISMMDCSFLSGFPTIYEKVVGYFFRVIGACLSPHITILANTDDSSQTILSNLDLRNPFGSETEQEYNIFKEFMAYCPCVIVNKANANTPRSNGTCDDPSNPSNMNISPLGSKSSMARLEVVHELLYYLMRLMGLLSSTKIWQEAFHNVIKTTLTRSRATLSNQISWSSSFRLDLLGVMSFLGGISSDGISATIPVKGNEGTPTTQAIGVGPFLGSIASNKYSEMDGYVLNLNPLNNSVTILTKSSDHKRHIVCVVRSDDITSINPPKKSYSFLSMSLVTELILFMKQLDGYTRLTLHDGLCNPMQHASNSLGTSRNSPSSTTNSIYAMNQSVDHPFLKHLLLRYIRPFESFYYHQMLSFLQGIFTHSETIKQKEMVLEVMKQHPSVYQFLIWSSLAINRLNHNTAAVESNPSASNEKKVGHGNTQAPASLGITPRGSTPRGPLPGNPNPIVGLSSSFLPGLSLTPSATPRGTTPTASRSNIGTPLNSDRPYIPAIDVTDSLLSIGETYLGSSRFLTAVPDRVMTIDLSDNDTEKILVDYMHKHLGINYTSHQTGSLEEKLLRRGLLREFLISQTIPSDDDMASIFDANLYLVSNWSAPLTPMDSGNNLGIANKTPTASPMATRALYSVNDQYPFSSSFHGSNMIPSEAMLQGTNGRLSLSDLDDQDHIHSLKFISNLRHNIVIMSRSLVQVIPMLLQFQTKEISTISRRFLLWQCLLPNTVTNRPMIPCKSSTIPNKADGMKSDEKSLNRRRSMSCLTHNASSNEISKSSDELLAAMKSSGDFTVIVMLFDRQIQFLCHNFLDQSQYKNSHNILETSDLFQRVIYAAYRWIQSYEDQCDEVMILYELTKILLKTLMNVFAYIEGCEIHMQLMRLCRYILRRIYYLQVNYAANQTSSIKFDLSVYCQTLLVSTSSSNLLSSSIASRSIANQLSTLLRLRATELLAKEKGHIHVNSSVIEENSVTFAYQLVQLMVGIEMTQRCNIQKPLLKAFPSTPSFGSSMASLHVMMISSFLTNHSASASSASLTRQSSANVLAITNSSSRHNQSIEIDTQQPLLTDIRSTSITIDISDAISDIVSRISSNLSNNPSHVNILARYPSSEIATAVSSLSDYIVIEIGLSVYIDNELPVYDIIYYGSSHSISHGGLTSNCMYSIRARAIIGGIPCQWSAGLTFQTHPGLAFAFDSLQSGPDIVISSDGLTATYSGDDNWSTLLCSQGFSSGIVSWEMRVNHSLTAYIFIGIASSQADLNTFLGGDVYGYGFIGEQALYHNREKIKIYGETFGAGDVIRVTVDFTAGTLSFMKNGQALGVAFDKIFGQYYPAVAFYNVGQEIEILPEKFTATIPRDMIPCSLSLLNINDISIISELIFCIQTKASFSYRLLQIIATTLDEWCSGSIYRYKTSTGKYVFLSTQSQLLSKYNYQVGERVRTPYDVAEIAGVAYQRIWFRFYSTNTVWYFSEQQILAGREKGYFLKTTYSSPSIYSKSPRLAIIDSLGYAALQTQIITPRTHQSSSPRPQMASLNSNPSVTPSAIKRNVNFSSNVSGMTQENASNDIASSSFSKNAMTYDPMTLNDFIDSNRWSKEMDIVLVTTLLQKSEQHQCSPWNVTVDMIVDDYRTLQQHLSRIVLANIDMSHRWGITGPKRRAVIARMGVLKLLNHMLEQYLSVLLHDELSFEKYDTTRYPLQQSSQSNQFFGIKQQQLAKSQGNEAYPMIISSSIQAKESSVLGHSNPLIEDNAMASDETIYLTKPSEISIRISSSFSPLSTSILLSYGSLNCIRYHIFSQLKMTHFWDIVNRSTGRPSKTDDDYDYPEELPQIHINRLKSFRAREASELIRIPGEDLYLSSMFCQLWHELRKYPQENLRISYTHPMDDGQSRSFKVKFDGEGVDDYGGPYREILQQICDELQYPDPSLSRTSFHRASTRISQLTSDSYDTMESKNVLNGQSIPCFVPLLFPSPNWTIDHDEMAEKYKYIFHPASISSVRLDLFRFLGQLVGIAIRSHITLDLSLASIIWKSAVHEILTEDDLQSFDYTAYLFIKQLRGLNYRRKALLSNNSNDESIPSKDDKGSSSGSSQTSNAQGLEAIDAEIAMFLEDVAWTAKRSDGKIIELIPHGRKKSVHVMDLDHFLALFVEAKLSESQQAMTAFRIGLLSIIPNNALTLLTGEELERIVCGNRSIDIQRLKENTEYDEDVTVDDVHIQYFWDVLMNDFNENEKSAFLRFVWARPTLPPKEMDFPQKFKIQSAVGDDANMKPDQYLPKAHTCFFSLNLPRYSSKEVCRWFLYLRPTVQYTVVILWGQTIAPPSCRSYERSSDCND